MTFIVEISGLALEIRVKANPMPPANAAAMRGASFVPQHISQWKAARPHNAIQYFRPGNALTPHVTNACNE